MAEQTSTLIVDAKGPTRKIPDTFLGAFFEVLKLEPLVFPQIFIHGLLLEMIQPYSSQLIVPLALSEIKSH
ncbi:hypothetical protein JHK84_053263 [Glycine max]|nr:hypothetical protein JHK86_053246 [Glycine max]KAG4927695.1 hypothetical protein JHK85_054181 [Glycine max]KAG5083225.1 hypothetical protein JHK84_053263 [Glycine max]